MAQIITEEAVILYDPIETIFDVQPIGGMLGQRQNTVTGEYSPDRSVTPMMLSPTLHVIDQNVTEGSPLSDETDEMTVAWYIVETENGTEKETEIDDVYDATAQDNADYEIYGKGLMVNANIPVGEPVHLRLKASYVNQNTHELLKFVRNFLLVAEPFVEFNPSIEVNIPNYSIVNPFKLTQANKQLAITAKFFAGTQDITSNASVTFLWEKLEGRNYRAIAATDVEVVSIARNVMTVDLECVGRCKYRVTAWHTGYSAAEHRRSFLMTLNRQLSGVTPQLRITRGKFLKPNISESEAQLVVAVNSHEISNPEDFFRAKWGIYKQHGAAQEGNVDLGWGNTAVADRSMTGHDKTRVPTFSMEVHSLSEYRLCMGTDGNPVTDASGEYIIGQEIEN